MTRPFRFGVNLLNPAPADDWAKKCRHAEELGYDVLLVPDHLEFPAPFPALVAAAHATERPKVGTFVLNAAFSNPVLLAREVATTDQLTGGRLELGLGAGYVREEFEQAGIDYGTPKTRVDHLERTVTEVTRLLSGRRPPLLVAGAGNRVLRLAAQHADVVAFTGLEQVPDAPDGSLRLSAAEAVDERVAAARRFAADAGTDPELNILIQRVVPTTDSEETAVELASAMPHLKTEQVLQLPTVLIGTPADMATQLHAHRDRFGLTYFTVLESAMTDFALVIAELRNRPNGAPT